jgi:hypothetical protein
MLYLLTSPLVYRNLKREILVACKTGRISSPVTNEEAKQLPYLQVRTSTSARVDGTDKAPYRLSLTRACEWSLPSL